MGVLVRDSSLDRAFPSDMIQPIYETVSDAWPRLGPIPPRTHEDKISRKLVVQMRPEARRRNLPVRIDSQYEVLDAEGDVVGRIEIVVSSGPREEVYFSLECKRLNVLYPSEFKTEADKYCERGMMRYVNEQYASGLRRGGMLGYVMDGRCDLAIRAVRKAAANRRDFLRLQHEEPLLRSSVLPGCPTARDSCHRTVTDKAFTVHHLFLPVDPSGAP